MLLKAYKTSKTEEVRASVKEEERKWIQDKLKPDYSFTDLLEIVRATYKNQIENEIWEAPKEIEQD